MTRFIKKNIYWHPHNIHWSTILSDMTSWLAYYIVIPGMSTTGHIHQRRCKTNEHDGAITQKSFPHYWPFMRGIHRSPWCRALMLSLTLAWTNCWTNAQVAVDFRRHEAHVMSLWWHLHVIFLHYIDVIMTTVASQITSLAVVYSIVYSGADQRKHQSSASLAFVRGSHRDRWISRTKGQ